MCGRFALIEPGDVVAEMFDVEAPDIQPRYNVAPTQDILAIRDNPKTKKRETVLLHWGLIPSWAKGPEIGVRTINARSETVAQKPSFRTALRRRRCLIPASGFYEWKKTSDGKQPYLIFPVNQKLLALAGLWEHWQDGSGQQIESCTILTTAPNKKVAYVHDRMPVILKPEQFETWLNPEIQMESAVLPMLRSLPEEELDLKTVDHAVNNARNQGPF